MKTRITFTLSTEVIEGLRRLRRERGIAAAHVVETSVRAVLEREGILKPTGSRKRAAR